MTLWDGWGGGGGGGGWVGWGVSRVGLIGGRVGRKGKHAVARDESGGDEKEPHNDLGCNSS